MSEHHSSRTAIGVAIMRAAHQLLEAPPYILDDPVVLALLGPTAEKRIIDTAEKVQAPERRALRSHIVLRSRFAEDRLAASLQRGVTQYVILGAGLDTFALRQPEWARSLRIFEVDHKATQDMKRIRIAEAGLSIPGNVHFVTIDFERESLLDGLRTCSCATDEPTFFSCLGVTMYISEDSIDSTLRSVAAFPAGSEIVLSFIPPRGDSLSPFDERAAHLGEPWISFFTPETMAAKLRAADFATIEFLTPAVAVERYYLDRPRDLPYPIRTDIVSAVKDLTP